MSLINPTIPSTQQGRIRNQSLVALAWTIILSVVLVFVGLAIYRQASIAGMSLQSYLSDIQSLFPFTIENLNQNLSNFVLPILWLALAVSWLVSLASMIVSSKNLSLMRILFGVSIYSLFLFFPFIFSGNVLISDLLLLFLVSLFGYLFFSERLMVRLIGVALLVGMIALVLDIYIPWDRQQPFTGIMSYALHGLLLVGFIAVFALAFRKFPLRQKLIFIVMAVSVLSIVTVVLVSLDSVERSIENTATQALLTAASQTVSSIENFLDKAIITIETEAQNTLYINYLSKDPQERTDEEVVTVDLGLFTLFSKRDYATQEAISHLRYLRRISLLDLNGEVLRDTDEQYIGQNVINEPYFVNLFSGMDTYISNILYDSAGLPYLVFSTQVLDSTGNPVGVITMHYQGSFFQEILVDLNNLAGVGSYGILVDQRYYVQIASGLHPELNFKTPLPINEGLVAEIQAQGVVPIIIGGTISSNQSEFVRGFSDAATAWDTFTLAQENAAAQVADLSPEEAAQELLIINEQLKNLQEDLSFTFPDPFTPKEYLAAYTGMKLVPWVMVYAQSREYFLEPLQRQVQNIQLLAVAVAVIAAGMAYVLSQLLAAPISSLTQVASGIAAGDFSRKAPIEADDEIGELALTVNTMADQLSQTVESLELRVEQRTRDLQRQSAQMQAAAEVGRAAVNLRNIDELLPQVCQLISNRFGFYHVGIFLIDSTGKYAALRAANSEGGQRMLERNHRLEVGQQGIVGNVTATGQPRIALDVGEDAVFFNNPDLPQTRSEAALPLQTGGRVFGALDVQSTEPGAFTADDIVVLRVMADLVATAIDNARLFDENQQALDASRRAYGEISQRGWSTLLQTQKLSGYRSSEQGIFQVQETPRPTPSSASEDSQDYTLSTPILVRNTILGYLKSRKPRERGPWTEDEVDTVVRVVEQLSIALESARLYKSSQMQAERERLIGEVSSRMRESLDIEAVLKTAAMQIRQSLDLKKVIVTLGSDNTVGVDEPAE